MKNIYNILVYLLIASGLFANENGRISGQVIDAKTKEPLAGVNVLVIDSSNGASTDLQGFYTIENLNPGTYRLQFLFIGYSELLKTDIIVSPAKPAVVNAELTEQYLESEVITVSAGYFNEKNITQPSISGLTREEIRRFPGGFEDVVRTVSALPGVAINNAGGRNDLLVRGGGPSENLFIVNNIEVPNINHFGSQGSSSGSLSFINLDFVDNITFSTGGFGARYGDKMSSVLNIDLQRGRKDAFGSKLLVSATQFGFNAEGPLGEKGDFIFSARKSYLDLIFKAAGLPFVPVYTDFNFIVDYDLSPKDNLFFLGLAAIDEVDRDQSNEENRVTNAGILGNTQYQYINGINYRRLINNGYFDVTANVNIYDFRFRQIDENEITYFKSNATEREYNLKGQAYLSLNKEIGVLSGLSAKFIGNDNRTVFADSIYNRSGNKIALNELGLQNNNTTASSAQKYSAFMEIDWTGIERLDLNFGVRADWYTFLNNSFYLSPRSQFKYHLTPEFYLKGSLGLYHQSPSYVWVTNPVNKNLEALKNTMSIIGFDYLAKADFKVSMEGYYKSYRNLPTGTIPGVTDYLVLTNTGTGFGGREDDFQSFGYFPLVSGATGNAYGVELALQKKYSDTPWYGQLSLTYSKSEYTAGNGKAYPGQFDQRVIFNLYGGYKLNDRWEFSGKYRYFTGTPYTPVYIPDQNTINPGEIQNLPQEYLADRLPAQSILDLRVDRYFNFSNWRFVVFLDIQNALNIKTLNKPRYDFWEQEIISESSIGILPSIGISAEF